jgi:hypothetical protein
LGDQKNSKFYRANLKVPNFLFSKNENEFEKLEQPLPILCKITSPLGFKLPLSLSNEFDKNESPIHTLQDISSLKLAPRDIG